jgi:predicted secreted hydrolase
MQVINKYQKEFLASWGPVFTDYSPITAQKAMANTSWLAQLFVNYQDPITNFTRILDLQGESLILYPIREAAEQVTYGEGLSVKGTVTMGTAGEIMIEPGYLFEDHITVYTFVPVRLHDKIRRAGVDYEVLTVQAFDLNGDPEYYKNVCRRLISQ